MNPLPRPLLAIGLVSLLGAVVGTVVAQNPPAAQPPTFRAGANFVRVDVYPTAGGRPVGDLTKDELEILEDGVPQTIVTFEHVSVRTGTLPSERVEPRSERESNELAADSRNRLFVLFLDTYHVTDPTSRHDGRIRMPGSTVAGRPREKKPLGPRGIDKAIVSFLDRAIGADDLVAAMSPEMDASRLVFTRRPRVFEEWVETVWGRRFSWDDLDPEEERWGICYPPDETGDPYGCYGGIFEEMVLRRRERATLRSLETLVGRLGDLRDGRKAVLIVSEGWAKYRPDPHLARPLPRVSMPGCTPEPSGPPGIYVGPGGKPQIGADPRTSTGVDRAECHSARLQLAMIDNEQTYRRLLDDANRSNVSFYPIDPRGLAVFDTPINAAPPGRGVTPPQPVTVGEDQARLRIRLEALRTLASATDGTMTETNDFAAGMKKIADDLSEYYLVGYRSTNEKLDGKFRRITVRARRPGVAVRARRGYLAPTEAEVKAATRAADPPDPEARTRDEALALLGNAGLDRAVRLAAGYEWQPSSAGGPPRPTLWACVELGADAARRPEWREGGDAVVVVTTDDGRTVTTERARLSPSARAFAWHMAGTPLEAGEYLVRVRVRGASDEPADASEQVRVIVPPEPAGGRGLGQIQWYRRGPSTGLAFQPTADARFRRVERLRLDVSLAAAAPSVSARVLDRRGQPLPIPVATSQRDEPAGRYATAEATLASLAPGDYLIEVTVGEVGTVAKTLIAFRIIP